MYTVLQYRHGVLPASSGIHFFLRRFQPLHRRPRGRSINININTSEWMINLNFFYTLLQHCHGVLPASSGAIPTFTL